LKEYALDPRKPIEELIKKYSKVDVNEVIKIVSKIIESNREELIKRKDKAFNIVMGLAMKELRYRVDGRIVADVVRNLIKELGQG
jgi:glutamyl-tRNA(Gln) amidotransferase subunit E